MLNDRLSPVFRLTTVNNGLSLKSLAADLLNVCLDKSLELRCSDWEADHLSLEQVGFTVFQQLACFSCVILSSASVNKSRK